MSIAPVLPPEVAEPPAAAVGAVVIPFRHRAPESPPEPELAPDTDSEPAVERPAARRVPRPRKPTDVVRPGSRVVRPATAPPPAPRLRLTRRGKVVVTVAGLLAALGLGLLTAHRVQTQTTIPSSAPAVVQVQPGDTVWSIAQRVAPNADPRSVVDAIVARNNLLDGAVHPGQRLVIRP